MAPAAATSLETDVRYRDWPTLHGIWQSGAAGSSLDTLTDGESQLVCDQNCTWAGAPTEIAPLFASVVGWVDRLANAGAPMMGPMRALAADVTDSWPNWTWGAAMWPLSTAVDTFLVANPTMVSFGEGHLVTGADATALSILRSNEYADQYSPHAAAGDFIPVRSANGRLIAVYVRDDIPFENASGLIRIP
jgi:hypothetical protein